MATAKAYAILVGPAGYGQFALLQATLSLITLVAGLGIGVVLIRVIAAGNEVNDQQGVATAQMAARILGFCGSALAAIALLLLSPLIGRALNTDATGFVLLAPAAIFSVGAGIETSTLNGFRRITALATAAGISSIVAAAASVTSVLFLGTNGIALGLLIGSFAAFFTAAITVRISVRTRSDPLERTHLGSSAWNLLASGIPYTVSAIFGTGALLAAPLLVGLLAGDSQVGFYRAASAISVGYLGFLVRAMSQDYYPRVSAAYQRPETLPDVITGQLTFVMIVSTPVILLTLALSDILVSILYSPEFQPAADVLHWQLAGDLLKLPAWTLSFVVLASGRTLTYLGLEVVGGIALLVSILAGVVLLGLVGSGVAYFATYAIYYPVALWLVARRVPVHISAAYLLPFALAALVGSLTLLTYVTHLRSWLMLGSGGLAIGAIGGGWIYFRRHRGGVATLQLPGSGPREGFR
jgi:PST family polysaccharide transporter